MSIDTIATISVSAGVSLLTSLIFVSYRYGSFKEKIDQLEKCSLNQRLSNLEGRFEVSQNAFFQRKSPISLTEKGVDALKSSGAKEFVDTNFEELYSKIEHRSPGTAYDIQEFSRSIASDLENDTRINSVKDYVYKNGFDFSVMANIMGIYLRDKALARKNWAQGDIDKSTPKES